MYISVKDSWFWRNVPVKQTPNASVSSFKKKNADVSGLSMFVEAPDIGVIAKT